MVAFSFDLYLIIVALGAVVAARKGRSGAAFVLKLVFGTVALELLVLWALAGTQDLGIGMILVALACAALGLILVTFRANTNVKR